MSPDATALELLVRRDDFHTTKVVPADITEAAAGQILLRIDKFGFSANNITYATLGDSMRYWNFFPGPEGWGKIPVWGYADVIDSKHDGIAVGERIFGYLPMSTHVVIQPDRVNALSFVDGAAHRADLPKVYQRYRRVTAEPTYDPSGEDMDALWRPLFMTSFGAADYLEENKMFGAGAVAFSSASSKTALGTAFLLARSRTWDVIGLTSPGNADFCERTRYYDTIHTYDSVSSMATDVPTLYVDVAGAGRLLKTLREHLGESLTKAVVLGVTHWDQRDSTLGGEGTEFFFLPSWIEKRRKDWAPGEWAERYAGAWSVFLPSVQGWMKVEHAIGPGEAEDAYRRVLNGKVQPDVGYMLTLWE